MKNHEEYSVGSGMEIVGVDIQTIYLYGLIIGGSIALLYMLFGDVLEVVGGIGDGAPGSILNPVVILSFISVFCGAGYVLELREKFPSGTNMLFSIVIAVIIVGIIHFFILVPLSKSEQNTAQSMNDFLHQQGEVILTIPKNGLGEILIRMKLGSFGHVARSATRSEIPQGTIVVVIAIEENDVLVVETIDS